MKVNQTGDAFSPRSTLASMSPRADFGLIAFLIALDVAARVLPHAPNWSPIAATALFAGTVLSRRGLALVVPLAALLISNFGLGSERWVMMVVVCASLTLPAILTATVARLRAPGMFVPVMAVCSLIFFVTTNFTVWAIGDLYPHTLTGLATCFVAALPFLQQTMIGDMAWAVALFGGAWLVRRIVSRTYARGSGAQHAA